jgi:hypothetical protein
MLLLQSFPPGLRPSRARQASNGYLRRRFRVEIQFRMVSYGLDCWLHRTKLTPYEAIMGHSFRPSLVTLLAIGMTQSAFAQVRPADQPATGAATLPWNAPGVLTGKERLGRKWMDEQRIDNCNVPIDKRGKTPRPSTCAHVPTG